MKVAEVKRWTAIVCIATLVTGFSACDKGNNGKEEDNVKQVSVANPSELNQTAYANDVSRNFTFTAKSNWTASIKEVKSSDVAWVRLLNNGVETYSGAAGTFTIVISLDVNTTGTRRSATIVIACGDDKITVTVTQEGTSGGGGGNGDPAEWIAITNNGFDGDDIEGIAYGDGIFVAVSSELVSDGKICRSTDGIHWNFVTTTTPGHLCVAYGDGTFIAGGWRSSVTYSTDNGLTWTDAEKIFTHWENPEVRGIAYGNGTFVAVGDNGKIAYSSDRGRNWTETSNSTFGNSQINGIAFGNNTFVAVGDDGKAAYSTNNGVTWTSVNSAVDNNNIRCIAYGNGTFVIAGGDGHSAYSTNGTSWTAVSKVLSLGVYFNGVAFGANTFVAAGDLGRIVRSTDNGKNWGDKETQPFGMFSGFKAVAFGNNTFVAVGDGGRMAYSKK